MSWQSVRLCLLTSDAARAAAAWRQPFAFALHGRALSCELDLTRAQALLCELGFVLPRHACAAGTHGQALVSLGVRCDLQCEYAHSRRAADTGVATCAAALASSDL